MMRSLYLPTWDDLLRYGRSRGGALGLYHRGMLVPPIQGSAYDTIQEEGVALTQRTILNLIGLGIKGRDDGVSKTEIIADDPSIGYYFYDDFVHSNITTGTIGWLGWNLVAAPTTAPTVAYQAGIAGRPGIIRLSTAATANVGGWMGLSPSGTNGPFAGVQAGMVIEYAFNLVTNTNMVIKMGLFNPGTVEQPSNGVYGELRTATDANFYGVCRAADAQTKTASALVANIATATWYRIKIRVVSTTSVFFSVDGGAEQEVTTNIPSTQVLTPGFHINTTEAVAKNVDIDYYGLGNVGITAR